MTTTIAITSHRSIGAFTRVHRDEEEEEEEEATRRGIDLREANLWSLECVPDAWRIARS